MVAMASLQDNERDTLAERMCAREPDAFREFSDKFGALFRGIFMSRGMKAAEAEELAVTCVSDISMDVEKYEPREESSFEAWACTIARNKYADWKESQPETQALPETLVAPEPDEKNVVRTETIVSAVQEAMVELSDTDQLLIELRYKREHRTFKEIGELLDMKVGTVRQRHSRALQQLKKILNQDGRITALLRRI